MSQEEKENQCGIVSGILDVTDTKCDKTDYVCCRKPDKNLEKCPDIIRPIGDPNQDPTDWSQCGRNASGSLVFTGEDSSYEGREFEAQPGELHGDLFGALRALHLWALNVLKIINDR